MIHSVHKTTDFFWLQRHEKTREKRTDSPDKTRISKRGSCQLTLISTNVDGSSQSSAALFPLLLI